MCYQTISTWRVVLFCIDRQRVVRIVDAVKRRLTSQQSLDKCLCAHLNPQARKTLATDEWMYQISAAAEADPLVAWKRCWQCLQAGGDGAGWYRAALEALADFIVEQKAPDPTAAWLERVLQHRCAEEAAGAHARPIMAGKHQVLVHYSLDNAADGVRAALREPFLRPRLGIFDAPQINVEEDGVLLCQDIS